MLTHCARELEIGAELGIVYDVAGMAQTRAELSGRGSLRNPLNFKTLEACVC